MNDSQDPRPGDLLYDYGGYTIAGVGDPGRVNLYLGSKYFTDEDGKQALAHCVWNFYHQKRIWVFVLSSRIIARYKDCEG